MRSCSFGSRGAHGLASEWSWSGSPPLHCRRPAGAVVFPLDAKDLGHHALKLDLDKFGQNSFISHQGLAQPCVALGGAGVAGLAIVGMGAVLILQSQRPDPSAVPAPPIAPADSL